MIESIMKLLYSDFGLSVGSAIVAAIISSYAVALSSLLGFSTEKQRKEQNLFFKTLKQGVVSGAVATQKDIENIYLGVRRRYSSNGYHQSTLAKWLREFLVEIITEKESSPSALEIKTKIDALIVEIEKENPYEALPDLERSLFLDLSDIIQSDNQTGLARKLDQLRTAIVAREDSISKLKSTNRWSTSLAVIGLILTIVFGVFSILPYFTAVQL